MEDIKTIADGFVVFKTTPNARLCTVSRFGDKGLYIVNPKEELSIEYKTPSCDYYLVAAIVTKKDNKIKVKSYFSFNDFDVEINELIDLAVKMLKN